MLEVVLYALEMQDGMRRAALSAGGRAVRALFAGGAGGDAPYATPYTGGCGV